MRRTQAQHTDPAQQRSSAAAAAYAGVDVSKDHLDLSVVGADGAPLPGLPGLPGAARHRRIANTPAGVRGLCAVLRDVAGADGTGLALVVLEATGAYHAPLLAALCGARLPVAVANPAQVKAYRQTLLGRNKTDRADALLLARFARAHGAVLVRYAPPPDEQRHLRQVLAYREQLATRRTALANQLEAARWRDDAELVALLEDDLADATRRLRVATVRVRQALAALPEAVPLQAACGVGPLVVAALLAYLPAAVWGRAKQAAACAGVHPAVRASGRTAFGVLSRAGSARLRRYLYLAALAARRHDPDLRAFFERLVARGKAPKAALAARMHKLLRRAMGRLRAWRTAPLLLPHTPALPATA